MPEQPEEAITETAEAWEPTQADYDAAVREMDQAAAEEQAEEPETFPRSYVEDLRQENGKYRQRAQTGDLYAQRLHTELVRATGKLADPTDIPFDETHLDSPDSLADAIDELLARKPHLASRRPIGDIGQGAAPSASTVDLAALLRERT